MMMIMMICSAVIMLMMHTCTVQCALVNPDSAAKFNRPSCSPQIHLFSLYIAIINFMEGAHKPLAIARNT